METDLRRPAETILPDVFVFPADLNLIGSKGLLTDDVRLDIITSVIVF